MALSYAQLLISLGKEEQASRELYSLIEREPTQMEARVALSLLLIRSKSRPNRNEIRKVLGPLNDNTQGPKLPDVMLSYLKRYIGL